MTEHAISSLIDLRAKLKCTKNCPQAQDLICKTNTLLRSLVKKEINIDFRHTTGPGNTLLQELLDLMLASDSIADQGLRAEMSAGAQDVLSACLNCTFVTPRAQRLPCDNMSAQDKQESIRQIINAAL
jgi:hypothetical protein